jgi:hypothetical protein
LTFAADSRDVEIPKLVLINGANMNFPKSEMNGNDIFLLLSVDTSLGIGNFSISQSKFTKIKANHIFSVKSCLRGEMEDILQSILLPHFFS